MNSAEPLLTIAEVSVAFAGFASIVTVVASRGLEAWGPGNRMRFRLMIYMSLSSVLFSLLPFSFVLLEVSESTTWGLSSAALALFLGSYLIFSIPGFSRLVRNGELNGYVAALSIGLGLVAVAVQVLSLVQIVSPPEGAYFVGVLYLLVLSAISFARLVAVSILPASVDESSSSVDGKVS
jgi:hypothetical protein